MRFGKSIGFVAAALSTALLTAHVRLRYEDNGAPLRWSDEDDIEFVIERSGSDNVTDGSHETAIRNAVDAWNDVDGSRARLVEQNSDARRARTDWQNYDLHTILFDESNTSGYFPGASGIVAITPLTFYTDGRIIDADILFNGKNFTFTTSGGAGRFDIQDVAAHELGHFLGLDHSGVCGATMYPYVDPAVILHRSLSLDDRGGMRHAYGQGGFASVQGTVERSDGSKVRGAHVVARGPSGRVAGATLTGSDGGFTLRGLDPGHYTLYADPLDSPVSASNLGGGQSIQTDFSTTFFGGWALVEGESRSIGTVQVQPDASINLGRVSDDYPVRVVAGATRSITIRGMDLDPGSTLTVSDPTLAVTSVTWSSSAVTFDLTVPAAAAPGHVDVIAVGAGGEADVLVGGLEVTPPDPVVDSVTPATGSPEGRTAVTISGSGFRAGARVVIGDRIYRDGATDGCTVVDRNTILLDTLDTTAGTHDVVVVDETGVEGRSVAAFAVSAAPLLTTTFPAVGAAVGGTTILLSGEDFVPGTLVEIDGVLQPSVEVESPTRMRVVTGAGVAGGPYILRVTAPGGQFAETAFAYVPTADPKLLNITPDNADADGGRELTIRGTGFRETTEVWFGVDVTTGEGGKRGNTEFINSTTLHVRTPSTSVGTKSVMAKDADTGQAHGLSSVFTFTGSQDIDDGGGGGCAAVPALFRPSGGPRLRDVIGGAGWIAMLYLLLALRARRRVRAYAA